MDEKIYGNYKTSWCPGCGNFGILAALKKALAQLEIPPHKLMIFSGIGQAAKGPHYLNCNMFNGLHGRSIPMATAAKVANHDMTVIAMSGDGCHYGEGGNHFIHALRRNPDITILAHDNQVYGLTKGQASPTSDFGFVSKEQPLGAPSEPFKPLAVAVAMKAGFVARSFSGDIPHLTGMIVRAVKHRGVSLLDILQPCPSFNKVQTQKFYKDRVKPLPDSYDPANWEEAMKTSLIWGDTIPIGVIYENNRPAFDDHFPALKKGPLVDQRAGREVLKQIFDRFA